MNEMVLDRLFGYRNAFDHPVTVIIVSIVVAALVITPVLIGLAAAFNRIGADHRRELWTRYRSWLLLVPLMIVPVLLGAAWTMAAVAVLSLWCYREYARATGLFREKLISLLVVVGIGLVTFAVVDHWYGLFVAAAPLGVVAIAGAAILSDRPKGYIQRVALGVLGFVMFGVCLGHLGYLANDANYRPMMIGLVFCVQINDIFAYITGKAFGRRKLAPNTSPNKTVAGSVGALVLTTGLVVVLGRIGFGDVAMGQWHHLLALGVMISIGGQLGDLMLSSIKRDLGIKDMGTLIPGHGGILDRFDSLLLVVPAVFHYVMYFGDTSLGHGQPMRILTLWPGV